MSAHVLDRSIAERLSRNADGLVAAVVQDATSGRVLMMAWMDDAALAEVFGPVAEKLAASEQQIVDELIAVQGSPADIGGYYRPDDAKATAVMRPSDTFNGIIATLD